MSWDYLLSTRLVYKLSNMNKLLVSTYLCLLLVIWIKIKVPDICKNVMVSKLPQ